MIAWLLRALLLGQVLLASLLAWWMAARWGSILTVPLAIAIAFVAVACLHPLLICAQFVVSRLAKSPAPPEHRLSLWSAIKTLDGELDASLRTFCWAQPFRANLPAPVAAHPAQPLPLLFIHGYFCNRGIWQVMQQAAARRGYQSAAIDLEPPFCSIDDYADQIERAVDALQAASAAPRVVVIAHSMGGLAARAWLRKHGHARLQRLVTIATPHAGTVLANFQHTTNAVQMRRGSLWSAALAASETPALRAKISTIFSYHDNIVAPQLSASLPGARNHAVSGVGHVATVYHPAVIELVFAEIGAPTDDGAPVI